MRFDRYLVENKYFNTRTKALVAIKEGKVLVNDKVIIKPSFEIKNDVNIIIKHDELEYVSRGGKKLEHAIKYSVASFVISILWLTKTFFIRIGQSCLLVSSILRIINFFLASFTKLFLSSNASSYNEKIKVVLGDSFEI